MISPLPGKRVNSLRGLLLWWICGSGAFLVLIYAGILEEYFRFGVTVRSKATFERNAILYAEAYQSNPDAPLPESNTLRSYRNIADIPSELLMIFNDHDFKHAEMEFVILDEYEDQKLVSIFNSQCKGAPCEVFLLYSYQLNEKDWLYMFQWIGVTENLEEEIDYGENVLFFIAFLILLLSGALAFRLIKKISQPVQQLATWADDLTLEKIEEQMPDFEYQELNQVAGHLNDAFVRIAESLENERQFLQHASHELRTPIAVASGNLEILEKLSNAQGLGKEEQQAFDRLKYSVKDMQQLTETLLWLHRDLESSLPCELVELNELVQHLVEQNNYLLEYKTVEVDVVGEEVQVSVPFVPCRIVLANLIRNAFQYTAEGKVLITLNQNAINIYNENTEEVYKESESSDSEDHDCDYGFGLGLELVEQIAARLGWRYQCEKSTYGRSTTITF